ncbi:MAG: adenylyltransferase, partial [Mariprofundaceae bacterium]
MVFDALRMEWKKLKLRKDPQCPLCGDKPTITELVTYEQACELKFGE